MAHAFIKNLTLFSAILLALAGAPARGEPAARPGAPTGLETKQDGDVSIPNYRFRDGEVIANLKLHYATLGVAHRDASGNIDNAVLVLHWTGADSSVLLAGNFVQTLYAQGRPLDASRYFLIFPDAVGHGKSSRPSDGLKAGFPHYRYADIVDLQHALVFEHLGVKHLRAIVGVSMGGMNAWQWAEAYPDAMDGVMPIVAFPAKVSGRNLLWRRMVIDAIKSDPDWNRGDYARPPLGWVRGYQVLRMMIDGVPHLQKVIPDQQAAETFLAEAQRGALVADPNNLLYSLEASADYDPEPDLHAIRTKVFALNFGDDEFNPPALRVLETSMPQVANGKFVVQPGSAESYGHLGMAHPEIWASHVAAFMDWSAARQ